MEKFLRRQDVSKLLQIPLRTIDYLVGTGQIPFSRIGKRSVRFSKERIQEWFKEREGVEFRQNRKSKK